MMTKVNEKHYLLLLLLLLNLSFLCADPVQVGCLMEDRANWVNSALGSQGFNHLSLVFNSEIRIRPDIQMIFQL